MHDREHYFDRPENVRLVLRILVVACVVLFLADFVYHRHAVHPWEGIWGFYAIYGFVACVVLVVVAKEMRRVVMRDEDYYDHSDD
jgi:hypothetical protein